MLVAAAGCGDSHFVKATGKVTFQGKPVPSTLVTFQPEDGSRPSKGLTNDAGEFTLRYSRQQTGVTRGRHSVFLTYVVGNEEELGKSPPKASKELKAVIRKSGDPKTSPLHYEVTENGQSFEITLE